MSTSFQLNQRTVRTAAPADKPLLWVLREELGLVGTKFGCGAGICRACTVHVDSEAVPSCVTPLASVAGKKVTTIEGLSVGGVLDPVQRAWVAQDVPQCGYCQPGMVMASVALLRKNRRPTDADIEAAVPNICRCGTYHRIKAAVHQAAGELRGAA